MRKLIFTLIVLNAITLHGQTTRMTVKATATRAASAQEQIAIASRLTRQMEQTSGPQKMELFAQAWSNLRVVREFWPNDKDAIVRSGILQGDLAVEMGGWGPAIAPLLEVLPAAEKTPMEPLIERRLGEAYENTSNVAEAEKHLLAAERTMRSAHLDRVEMQAILSGLAMFYSRQNKPREAIQRFREAMNLPGQDHVGRIGFQVSIAEQTMRFSPNEADTEFARVDDLILAARKTTLSPSDANLVNVMADHAQQLRRRGPK